MDDKVRDGLSPTELAFMKDMATTIMIHFENVQAHKDLRKGERMLRGLGSFIEGNSSFKDWWIPGERISIHHENEYWSSKQYNAQNHHLNDDLMVGVSRPIAKSPVPYRHQELPTPSLQFK